jgi:hypothetical protein
MIWWILLLGSVALFLCVEMFLLPRLLLESKYSIGQTYDRGIKRYKSADNCVSVAYVPNLLVRKYIKQYVIVSKESKKTFKCMVKDGLSYLDFDIVLFNSIGKVFKVITVQSVINGVYTEEVELPKETSYVTLLLRQADYKEFPNLSCTKISPVKILIFGLTTCIWAVATAYLMNLCIANIFGGVFRESYAQTLWTNIAVIAVALVATAIGTIILSINLAIKNRKK